MLASATIDKMTTKNNLYRRIFLFVIVDILFFILIKLMTRRAWATSSKIINARRTKRLKSLYKSKSNLIPRKIECKIKNTAELIPKIKKYIKVLM